MWLEENGEEYEDTIPHCWIDKENNIVRWPKRMGRGQVDKAIKAKMTPEEGWLKFKLKKIKKTSGKFFFFLFVCVKNQVKMLEESMFSVELSNF